MATRSEIVARARANIGTPFGHQGRTPGVELDCIGEILDPLWFYGFAIEDVIGYSAQPSAKDLRRYLKEHERAGIIWQIAESDLLPADFILVRIDRDPQHFAWVADYTMSEGHLSIIHATNDLGVVETRLGKDMRHAIIKCYRIRGVE